jgi:hypothetical protein
MKTNNKLHPVFNYLLNSIDFEGSNENKINFVLDSFDNEYNQESKKYISNLQNRFSEYLKGLPSCLNIVFYNYDILQLAKSWGSLPENATEKQEDKIINNYFNFMAAKFFQLCKQNKVNYSNLY